MAKKNINRWDNETIGDINEAFDEAIASIEEKYSVNIKHQGLVTAKTGHAGYTNSGTRLDLALKGLTISLDPDLMGVSFSEAELKDWKTYKNNF